jgi:hypothetical protein
LNTVSQVPVQTPDVVPGGSAREVAGGTPFLGCITPQEMTYTFSAFQAVHSSLWVFNSFPVSSIVPKPVPGTNAATEIGTPAWFTGIASFGQFQWVAGFTIDHRPGQNGV